MIFPIHSEIFKRHTPTASAYVHSAAKHHALSVAVTQFDPFSHHTPHLTFLTLIFPHSLLYIYFFHDNKLPHGLP